MSNYQAKQLTPGTMRFMFDDDVMATNSNKQNSKIAESVGDSI